jgi:plasmid maintenance system antidote protein VapI
MTTAFVIYVVIASVLACSVSVYVSIQLYMDLEKLRKQDQIQRNVENARLNMFSL